MVFSRIYRKFNNLLQRGLDNVPKKVKDQIVYSSPTVPDVIGERPDNYMDFFSSHTGGVGWYEWMYDSRKEQHRAFQHWFSFVSQLENIQSILEFGCGYGVGYTDFFSDRKYLGIDMSRQAIEWCRSNRDNELHTFMVGDFIDTKLNTKFDLVFSQGTIDNTYDIDGFLRNAASLSSKWIYISAYRGYFGELPQHDYRVVKEQGTFYNDISAAQVYKTLKDVGATDIAVVPSYTGGRTDSPGTPYETVIIANVSNT